MLGSVMNQSAITHTPSFPMENLYINNYKKSINNIIITPECISFIIYNINIYNII